MAGNNWLKRIKAEKRNLCVRYGDKSNNLTEGNYCNKINDGIIIIIIRLKLWKSLIVDELEKNRKRLEQLRIYLIELNLRLCNCKAFLELAKRIIESLVARWLPHVRDTFKATSTFTNRWKELAALEISNFTWAYKLVNKIN